MIAFYNHVFVPVVKTDLLKVNQIKADLPLPPLAEGLRGTSPVRDYMRYAMPCARLPYSCVCVSGPAAGYNPISEIPITLQTQINNSHV